MKVVPQTSVGVEIAGRDLQIAVLRQFAGKRRLVRLDRLTGFLDLSEDEQASQITAHFKKHKLSGINVHLTLPGASGVTRDLEFPATAGAGEMLRSAVALQLENLSPWATDEIYWDCASEPPAKASRTIVVHVAIVPRTVLDPWIALFTSARLALTGASLSSLSWAHGVTVFWGKERPVMILTAENDSVEAALVSEDRVYAVHTAGGDPAQSFAASASQLMRAGRIDSIERIRFVGHGPFGAGAGLEPAPLPIEASDNVSTGFGAVCSALLGLARSGFSVNVIPAPLRHQRNYIQLIPTYALACLVILLGLFAWLREPYQQSVYAQRLDDEAKRVAVQVRSVADQEAQLNRISDRLKGLDTTLRGRDSNLEALRELSRVLPPGTWLTSYACQENVVTIAGYSESAASIQKLLEDSPIFRDVQFTSSITRDVGGKDRFNIRAAIEVKP